MHRLVLSQGLLRQRHHATKRTHRPVTVLKLMMRWHVAVQVTTLEVWLHRQHILLRRVQFAVPSFTLHNERSDGRSHGLAVGRVSYRIATVWREGYELSEKSAKPGALTASFPRAHRARPSGAAPMRARIRAPPRPRADTRAPCIFNRVASEASVFLVAASCKSQFCLPTVTTF